MTPLINATEIQIKQRAVGNSLIKKEVGLEWSLEEGCGFDSKGRKGCGVGQWGWGEGKEREREKRTLL